MSGRPKWQVIAWIDTPAGRKRVVGRWFPTSTEAEEAQRELRRKGAADAAVVRVPPGRKPETP